MSRFHSYSFGNVLEIARQMPTATRVAGFWTWKNMGRSVNAGAKGIRILAPIVGVRRKKDEEAEKDITKQNTHYYVVDTTATDKQKNGTRLPVDQAHESYATLSFVPNLSNTGNILILSGTGGAASGAALDFLSDEHSMMQLHDLLTHDKKGPFPHFEVLLKVVGHNSVPRNSSIVLCRRLKP